MKESSIPRNHRDLLFLELVVAMEEQKSEVARQKLKQLSTQQNLIPEMKSALAGYGLKLREPGIVRLLIEPFVDKNDEIWSYYYQVSLAYMQQQNARPDPQKYHYRKEQHQWCR